MLQLDWDATLDDIRANLPQTQFVNWFKPLELVRCDEKTLVLGVPSRFHEDWLKQHYGNYLTEKIKSHYGPDLQLEFEILSHDSIEPTAPTVTQRPILRVITTKENDEIRPTEIIDPPNTPNFSSPFFEIDYNHVAFQCAALFSSDPHFAMHPLVIQGGVGTGKTHLLSEIGKRLQKSFPKMKIRYTNFESFTGEMVSAIKTDKMLAFKKKYREETDCLLFDDIHGLTKRIKTQEELLHTFNEITVRGGRVAFSSHLPVHRLEEFIEPLKSRLASGLLAEIRPASYDDKLKLLAHVALHHEINVSETVLRSLADQAHKDIRELIGTFIRLHLHSKLENQVLDNQYLARQGCFMEPRRSNITLLEIVALIENNLGISRTEIISKSRKGNVAWARQVAMYLARHFTLMPLSDIGKAFGRDHATVIHSCQKIKETMELHPTRRYEVEFLMQKIQTFHGKPTLESPSLEGPTFEEELLPI